jgi:transcriptional regulator with XRE-family HTH domain
MNANHEALYQLIGHRVKTLRERMSPRMSQEKLAGRIGLTRASLVNIEAGRQKAPVHVLWSISEIFNVELSELIPLRGELAEAEGPIHLTEEQIASIEQAATDDPRTKRLLESFVSNTNKARERQA